MKANLFMELTLLARAFRACYNYCSILKLKTTPFNSPRSNGVLWTKGKTPSSPFFYPHARVFWFIWQLFFSLKFFKYYYCLNWDFRRHAFSPQQLLNKKQKIGLVLMGGALVYVSVKRSPCVLVFVCGWFAPAAQSKGLIKSGKRWAFVSFGLQKEESSAHAQHVLLSCWCKHQKLIIFPLIAAGVASVFCLETKGTKTSRNNNASALQAIHPARRSFILTLGYSGSFGIYIFQ